LYAKLRKCTFYQNKIPYLGHIVLEEGIAVDLENIEAIKSWLAPKNISEVRSFMGLVGYYRRFIAVSRIAHPITSLQMRGVKFEWSAKCEETFQCLKDLLTNAPILKVADPDEDFVVCTYACKEGLDGVLMQNGHVICYESKKLKEHEINYVVHDLELAAIVHALRIWRHYLMGRKFELRTEHSGLKYLIEQPTLNARQTRWLEFLSEYNFDIKHIRGKQNKVVDALNTRVHKMHATTISMYMTDLKERILELVIAYQHYVQVKESLQQNDIQQKYKDYKLEEDGILLFQDRFYIPNYQELRNLILKEMHNVPYAGHPGYQKTITAVRGQYFWPGMKKDVTGYLAKCMECQKVKAKHRHPTRLLQSFPIPEWKWGIVTIDFITKLPRTTRQHDSIMVVVEKLIKVAHFIMVKLMHKKTNIA
jgi:hypothetical protein